MDWKNEPSLLTNRKPRLMKKIIIVATSFDEHEILSGVAQHHKPGYFQFEVTASFGQSPEWWSEKNPDLLILSLPDEEPYLTFFVNKLKNETDKKLKMIWIVKDVSSELMKLSTTFEKVRILKRPFEDFGFYRAMVDLTTDYEEGKQQIHPRYSTEQDVKVLKKSANEVHVMKMRNLSRGGTYLESLATTPAYNLGDILEIDIFLEGLQREYKFEGEVVWKQEPTGIKKLGLGIRFVQTSILGNILDSLES